MTLVIGSSCQVGIEMTCSGQKVMNVIGIHMPGPFLVPDVLAAVKTAWEASNGPLARHPNSTVMVGYHGTDLNTVDGAVGFLGSAAIGSKGTDISFMAACAVVKLSSGTRARSQQGRLFHGPLVESQVSPDGRTLSTDGLNDLNSAYTGFHAAMIAADMPWKVLSRKFSIGTEITNVSVGTLLGSQHRRLR